MRPILLVALVTAGLPGQTLSGAFNLPIAAPGQANVLRLSNGGPAAVTLQNGCGYNAIVAGTPTGPAVFTPFICPLILITIAPCQTRNVNFTVPSSASPGVYYIRVNYTLPTAPGFSSEFFPFSVAPNPTLTTAANAQIGTSMPLTITAPPAPGSYFIAAASFSTNTGIPISPALFVSLDNDFLFQLSFPTPDPLLFTNFQNALPASGTATIAVNIPNFPPLLWKGLALQAAVVDPAGAVSLTNPLTFSFVP